MKHAALVLALLLATLPLRAFAEGESLPDGRPKIALALGGGGAARGAAHIGVLKVFEQEKIPLDFIVGTSMGAIIGGTYAAGVPLERIVRMMHDKSLLHAYDTVPIPLRVAIEPFFALAHLFGKHPYEGLYRGNRFAHFIDRFVPADHTEVEKSKIPFWAIGTDLITGKVFIIKRGNLGRAVQASAAIPFLRRPVPIEDGLLVDGGVLANVPSFEAKQTGADIVIAVDVDEEIQPIDKDRFRMFASVPNRTISLILEGMDKQRSRAADFTIRPDVAGLSLLSINVKEADQAMNAGEKAARDSLPKIRELIESRALAKSK